MFYKFTTTVRMSDTSQPSLTKEKQAIWEEYSSDGRAIHGEVIATDDPTINKYVAMFESEEIANQYFAEIDALGNNSNNTVLDTQTELVSVESLFNDIDTD